MGDFDLSDILNFESLPDDFSKLEDISISDVLNLESLPDELKKRVQTYDDYLKSDEFKNECKPYDEIDRKYVQLYEQYKDSFEKLHDEMKPREYRREYAKGSVGLHRGYYSPSIQDLYVGGTKPGRLLKRPPKNNNYDTEYVFDEDGKMICCKTYWLKDSGEFFEYTNEFFLYGTDKVTTFTYWFTDYAPPKLTIITESSYKDELLVRFEEVQCHLVSRFNRCSDISIEDLEYEDGLLKSSVWHNYVPDGKRKYLRKMKYTFFRNEVGEIVSYTPEFVDAYSLKKPRVDPLLVYKVKSKRRLIK